MYKLEDIRDVHLELTTKCQARCPMCPRRINGGPLNPLITLDEITLDTFKEWFTVEFIQQLDSLFMCGNLGDPIIAKDCAKILEYLRETNPNIRLSMHTNGSARSWQFWKKLAELDVRVVFGIDGLLDVHKLYRVDTDWVKIIDNAKMFIQHGGKAEWHMLVFQHNEHQVDFCEELATRLGFVRFQSKHTSRFVNGQFNALDEQGKTTHVLLPSTKSEIMTIKVEQAIAEQCPKISCKAIKYKQIYVAGNGNVSPCCWLDAEWFLPNKPSRIDYMDRIGRFPNLKTETMKEIFDSGFFNEIESTWASNPLQECAKQCGSFDKLGAQFAN
jgi:MoaA/NifB/PqqE/SkfB family radical SAM enzyme